MSDQLISSVVTVLTAIVGVAIIAVLVSNKANTAGVLGAGGGAFATALEAAVSPVTGQVPQSSTPLGVGFGGVGNNFYQ
jgi:hypothetical protein